MHLHFIAEEVRMDSPHNSDDETEMGLQFNPSNTPTKVNSSHVSDTDMLHNASSTSNNNLNTSYESQEIMVGDTGKAILVGDEINLESDGRGSGYTTSSKPQKRLDWLNNSSPKTKAVLSAVAIVLIVFVAILAVGATQLSSPTNNDDGSSSLITTDNENTATDTSAKTTPSPSKPPIQQQQSDDISTIPISNSQVNIVLPPYLEAKIPDWNSDVLSSQGVENWNEIEMYIQNTITQELEDSMPSNYEIETVEINTFDGLSTSFIRKLSSGGSRSLQTIHTVTYSTNVKVDCTISDCSTADDVVSEATFDLSQKEYIEISVETNAPVASPKDTPSPVVSTPSPITPEEVVTPDPTLKPSTQQSKAPVTEQPTGLKFLGDRINGCNIYTPCEACLGACSGDDECETGLLCLKRMGYSPVPGCQGAGRPNQSYCYDPFSEGLTEADLLVDEDQNCKGKCKKCEGDCDDDDDCDKNLFCFRRSSFELVPGCAGLGIEGRDYCFDPSDISGDF